MAGRAEYLLLGTLLGCDQQANLLVVDVGSIPPRATSLSVNARLNGASAQSPMDFVPPVDRIAVRLTDDASGHLDLMATAFDSDHCTQASSTGAIDLPTNPVVLTMPLQVQSPRKCGQLAPCAAKSLCSTPGPSLTNIQGMWATSATDIWAVGNGALILHFDGINWTSKPVPVNVSENLYSVWASGPNNVWAVGAFGRMLRYDGNAWSSVSSPTTLTLYGIWGVSPTEIWAVGDSVTTTAQGTFLRYNGTSWQAVTDTGLGTGQLNGVWADSPNFIYVCGVGGLLARYNGTMWNTVTSGTTINIHAIWGTPGGITASTVYAVGDSGTIIRIRYAVDTQWTKVPSSGTTSTLYAITGDSNLVYAVGSGGTIVRAEPPFDSFIAQSNTMLSTLFAVRTASNGLTWVGGGGGFLGYQDTRP